MVLPTFVRQALAGQPITVFGDGTQSRSFTYVGDVVDALIKLAEEPSAVATLFNIGNTSEVTILELAERVKKMTKSASAIEIIPYDVAYEAGFEDMPRRVPDISKIQSLVGYEPKLGLDDIITLRGRALPAVLESGSTLTYIMGIHQHAASRSAACSSRRDACGVASSVRPGREPAVQQRAVNAERAERADQDDSPEWARLGGTRIVNGERIGGGPGHARAHRWSGVRRSTSCCARLPGYHRGPRARSGRCDRRCSTASSSGDHRSAPRAQRVTFGTATVQQRRAATSETGVTQPRSDAGVAGSGSYPDSPTTLESDRGGHGRPVRLERRRPRGQPSTPPPAPQPGDHAADALPGTPPSRRDHHRRRRPRNARRARPRRPAPRLQQRAWPRRTSGTERHSMTKRLRPSRPCQRSIDTDPRTGAVSNRCTAACTAPTRPRPRVCAGTGSIAAIRTTLGPAGDLGGARGPTVVGHYPTLPVRVSRSRGSKSTGAWGADAMVAPERDQQGLGEALVRAWDRNSGAARARPSPEARDVLDRLHWPPRASVPCLVKPLTRRAVRLPHWPTPVNRLVSAVTYPFVQVLRDRGRCAPSASRSAASTRRSRRCGKAGRRGSTWRSAATPPT